MLAQPVVVDVRNWEFVTLNARPLLHRIRRMLRRPTWRGWFSIVMATIIVAGLISWVIDYRTLGTRVARNVTIENVDIGRLQGPHLARAIDRANAEYGRGNVDFVIDGRVTRLSAAEIGLELDEKSTLAEARKIERDDPPILRPVNWAMSFVRKRHAPVKITLSTKKLATALAKLPGQTAVKEPTLVGTPDAIGITAGKGGFGFDPEVVSRRIRVVARDGDLPIKVTLVAQPVAPKVSDDQARALAVQAYQLTRNPLEITSPTKTMTATPALLRSWVTSEVKPGSRDLGIAFDEAQVRRDLIQQLGRTQVTASDASFTVIDSRVQLVPQVEGQQCCSAQASAVIIAALRDHQPSVAVPLSKLAPKFTTQDATKLGITTLLGAATQPPADVTTSPPPVSDQTGPNDTSVPSTTAPPTVLAGQTVIPVPAGAGVMDNVQLAIDRLRGRIMLPGKTLSLNEVLGPPSPDNGFVPAAVSTADGPSLVSGGGTDLVAAALFASAYDSGLDIPSSQRHDVMLPGLPLGREATLGWTQPDLVLHNTSRYGVLVWVDLVQGGIRVQLFSTPWVGSVTSTQRVVPTGPDGKCQNVTVTRTRNFIGGGSNSDSFTGTYGPPPGGRDDPDRVICPR